MGRGRAKAKQTKVARELKYHSPNTDLTALQRELAGSGKSEHNFDDDYKEYVDDDDEDHADDDPDTWARPTR
ncbi:DUF3073 domain-containing protein [Micromonospora aurantiaca]|jgi:hypothetical protein|uniref:DUF3073 domain-containing protein n=7 Tax=Micromonospora TaxID=1873 RepID=A0A1C6TBE0_9ACTN|nr:MULTISPECIES: DUF3073 domain-containing protein [Micromonospora]ADL43789.1 Protein of unknown function DUF3073 [Micromonospora aurantiaca ATCC 27029]ADU05758.1 Protein of unknown function DUF3073 [Micromonospora sp. L5]ATO15617.1 DUF3073 domain-containing protein [Micromonospora sp. WMMA2032]AXH90058.1 DUF3073 domain-containing protein [Micromonospora aurantiaca]AYF30563.1 DUF3073 domain-containing protein [Micromonospora tulbaghiae]